MSVWRSSAGPKAFARDSLRKEVIQPQLPLQLPCYDFVPVTSPTLGGSLLAVGSPISGVASSHVGGLQPTIRTETGFLGLAPPHGFATHCTGHCSVCVAQDIKAMLT